MLVYMRTKSGEMTPIWAQALCLGGGFISTFTFKTIYFYYVELTLVQITFLIRESSID